MSGGGTPVEPAPPVFMFGFERSGTTLLSMMVGAHPRVAVPLSVTGMWYRYHRFLDRYNHLRTIDDVERMVDDLLAEERIGLWDASLQRDEILDGLHPGSYPDVIARFHGAYARHKGKELWANIDIATLEEMDVACRWFPASRFVHIVRDGRDVALSHETYPYGASNAAECAAQWLHALTLNMKMGAILGPERYLVVRYEDLVLDTESTLRRLCAFMGLDYAPAMMSYHSMVRDKVPEEKRWLWPSLDRPPVADNVYRWRTRMSRSKRIVFESAAGPMLHRLGYETYGSIPKSAAAFALELFYFLGRGHRLRRLARKLGIRSARRLERDHRRRKAGSKGA